jgi:hypothetical protein
LTVVLQLFCSLWHPPQNVTEESTLRECLIFIIYRLTSFIAAEDVIRRRSNAQGLSLAKRVACRIIEIDANFLPGIARYQYQRRGLPPIPQEVVLLTKKNSRYIKKLERELNELRAGQKRPRAATPSGTTDKIYGAPNDQAQLTTNCPDMDVSNPLLESPAGFVAAGSASLSVYVGEGSSVAFGDTVLKYVDKDTDFAAVPPAAYFEHETFNRLLRAGVNLPDRIESRLLVEVAIRFIGTDFHLVMKKSFFETLDRVCTCKGPQDLLWACKYFALLALGEIYSSRKRRTVNQHVPGTDYFLRAVRLLQDRYEDPSLDQVEIMILFVSCLIQYVQSQQNFVLLLILNA